MVPSLVTVNTFGGSLNYPPFIVCWNLRIVGRECGDSGFKEQRPPVIDVTGQPT